MNDKLIQLIQICLSDGEISDKEREVIFRKAKELGVAEDECEIILEGMTQQVQSSTKEANIPDNQTPVAESGTNNVDYKKPLELKVIKFNNKEKIEQNIIELENEIKEVKAKKEQKINEIKDLESEIQKELEELRADTFEAFKNLDYYEEINLGDFSFTPHEIISSKNFNYYYERQGTVEWGNNNAELKPEYPHPIAVLLNHNHLGRKTKQVVEGREEKLSGYMKNDKFHYFTDDPVNFLKDEGIKPIKILIQNLPDWLRIAVIITNDEFRIFRMKFRVDKIEIKHELREDRLSTSYSSNINSYVNPNIQEIKL